MDQSNREQDAPATPRLRFPEFRDTKGWDIVSFNEILTPIVRATPKPAEAYLGLGLRSHGKGTFLKLSEDPLKNSMDQLYEVKAYDLIINITFAWEGAVAIAKLSDDGALVSHRFPTYTFEKGKTTPEFFRYIILEKQFVYKLGLISPGGAGRNRVMSKNDFLYLKVALPTLPEQQRIADCLSSLDALIAAQARKVDALKSHKKGLMQQLFPRDGETQPRLRFPEFQDAGEWEETTLGEKSSILRGKGISKADLDPHGLQACIRYGELYTRYGETIREVVSRTKVPASELFISKPDDVIIPSSGETKIDIAKASCVLAGGIALGGDLNVIRSNLNGTFLSYYLNGPKRLDIAKVAQGDTVVHLYPHQLEALHIAVPTLPEQQRIADCLSSLDALITAATQRLATLKTHKQGLMQQLFPSMDEVES